MRLTVAKNAKDGMAGWDGVWVEGEVGTRVGAVMGVGGACASVWGELASAEQRDPDRRGPALPRARVKASMRVASRRAPAA